MTTPQLPIWSILASSLVAPFGLSATSYKALLRPIFALAVSIALLLITRCFKLNAIIQLLAQLPVWVSVSWFALEYQRQLVVGSEHKSEARMWRRYGVFFLVLVSLCLFLALLLGLLLYLVLPAIAWFSMALKNSKPWLASGSVLIWILLAGTASYSEENLHKIEGNGQFFTLDKRNISIQYGAFWHVVDADTYFRATASQPQQVSRRIELLLQQQLRDQISRQPHTEVKKMIKEGRSKFSIENEQNSESPFDAVLKNINSRAIDLGIEVTAWYIENY